MSDFSTLKVCACPTMGAHKLIAPRRISAVNKRLVMACLRDERLQNSSQSDNIFRKSADIRLTRPLSIERFSRLPANSAGARSGPSLVDVGSAPKTRQASVKIRVIGRIRG